MQDDVFFARFEALEPITTIRASSNDLEQLRQLLNSNTDVPLIMNTMKEAIKRMVVASVGKESA
jgi:hypothetical protein